MVDHDAAESGGQPAGWSRGDQGGVVCRHLDGLDAVCNRTRLPSAARRMGVKPAEHFWLQMRIVRRPGAKSRAGGAASSPSFQIIVGTRSCLRNGTADRGTIQLLEGIAGDDETDREVRETARAVAAALVKKARAK